MGEYMATILDGGLVADEDQTEVRDHFLSLQLLQVYDQTMLTV